MIIIPDIHGRTFWKSAVEQVKSDEHVLFLGDYLDPYRHEGINANDALLNLREILEYAKSHESSTTLLLGNHDIHYLDSDLNGSRKDIYNCSLIQELFENNKEVFSPFYRYEKYLFSHAGFSKGWIDLHYKGMNVDEMLKSIEERFATMSFKEFAKFIWEVSYHRGGWTEYGSFIWADISEHSDESIGEGIIQIVGHNQLKNEIIGKHLMFLDRRDAFRLENNNIKRITFEDYYEKD